MWFENRKFLIRINYFILIWFMIVWIDWILIKLLYLCVIYGSFYVIIVDICS